MPDKDHQQPLKIGTELTQYKIEKVLGRGGFGITYLAMDLNLERQVVIKEFFPREQVMRSKGSKVQPLSSGDNNSIYKNSLKKFLAEGRTLAKFRHNNIALVLTAFPENNTAYLVMEYNQGETLAEFIKKRNRPLDFTQIKKLFLPICKGLQALHKQDLLHLDIKPDNIYLPDKGEPYLIDFGGVRQFIASKDVSASFMVLTPGYAPAEQHSDTSKLGFYSDIYALGMTLYYTLTLDKKLPQSTDRQQSLFEGDDDPLPLLADSIITKNYPKDFIALAEQAIQPNRKHRLQDLKDLINVLKGEKIKPRKQAKPASNNTKNNTGFFKKLYAGDFGLAKTFWIFGVLAFLLLFIIIGSNTLVLASEYPLLILLALALALAYSVFMTIAIWKSANKYIGNKFWAVLARITALITFMFVIGSTILVGSLFLIA